MTGRCSVSTPSRSACSTTTADSKSTNGRRCARKSSDHRPESYKVDEDSIKPGVVIGTARGWEERKTWVLPHLSPSMEALRDAQATDGTSLGLIKPTRIERFWIHRGEADWDDKQRASLARQDLFRPGPPASLQKIPWEFGYRFWCDDPRCHGHDCQTFDWEVHQSYRHWSATYCSRWQDQMQEKYGQDLVQRCDLHFFVGTVASHPTAWTIVGLFYPPKVGDRSQVSGGNADLGGKRVGDGQPMTQAVLDFEAE